jgi:predicted nucleic acid-binding Zn ribbon protein
MAWLLGYTWLLQLGSFQPSPEPALIQRNVLGSGRAEVEGAELKGQPSGASTRGGEHMEQSERRDPTFIIFVVLATIFLVVVMYVTFPRQEAQAPAPSKAMESPFKK